jgi:C-terminal processing protease CtpA/Prc
LYIIIKKTTNTCFFLKIKFLHILVFSLVVLTFSACSLKKNTWSTRAYQSMNTRFNVYFNGKESYEEYATLSPDFGLPYDEFLDGVLMRMRTNDLDKKFRNGRWQLYSNIQRLSPVSRTALSADIDSQFPKEPVYGFGIVSLAIISYTDNGGAETGQYGFAVMAVYPDSPMARAGLGRGTIINQVDGQWITAGNLNTVYSKLLAPNGAATLSVADNQGGFGVSEHKLTAELIYENPVLHRK